MTSIRKGEFQEAKKSEQHYTMEADCWALHHHSASFFFFFLLRLKLRTVKVAVGERKLELQSKVVYVKRSYSPVSV